MFLQEKGQAMLETCVALPIAILFLHLVLMLVLSLSTHYLADHWIYQSSLCLAKNDSLDSCKQALKSKLGQLPLTSFRIIHFSMSSQQAAVKVEFHSMGLAPRVFTENLRLPLRSNDFRRLF